MQCKSENDRSMSSPMAHGNVIVSYEAELGQHKKNASMQAPLRPQRPSIVSYPNMRPLSALETNVWPRGTGEIRQC